MLTPSFLKKADTAVYTVRSGDGEASAIDIGSE